MRSTNRGNEELNRKTTNRVWETMSSICSSEAGADNARTTPGQHRTTPHRGQRTTPYIYRGCPPRSPAGQRPVSLYRTISHFNQFGHLLRVSHLVVADAFIVWYDLSAI